MECLARHIEGDRGQEHSNFREKGVRAVNRPTTMAGSDGFGRSPQGGKHEQNAAQ